MIILLIIIHLPVLPLAGTAAALAPTTAGREARDDPAGQALEHTPVQLLHNELGLLHRRKSEQGRGYSHTRLGDDPRRHQGPEPGEDVADGLFFLFFLLSFFVFLFSCLFFPCSVFLCCPFFFFLFSLKSPSRPVLSEAPPRRRCPRPSFVNSLPSQPTLTLEPKWLRTMVMMTTMSIILMIASCACNDWPVAAGCMQ